MHSSTIILCLALFLEAQNKNNYTNISSTKSWFFKDILADFSSTTYTMLRAWILVWKFVRAFLHELCLYMNVWACLNVSIICVSFVLSVCACACVCVCVCVHVSAVSREEKPQPGKLVDEDEVCLFPCEGLKSLKKGKSELITTYNTHSNTHSNTHTHTHMHSYYVCVHV